MEVPFFKLRLIYLMVMFLILPNVHLFSQNRITLIITSTPRYTPEKDTLYLGTSLDNWKTDPQKKFKYYPDGSYRLSLDIGNTKSFEYKINRGDWYKAEGDRWGDFLENRRFTFNDSIYEISLQVQSWEDLYRSATIPVIVNSLPESTPEDAQIYIAGNFNNWITNDSAHKLVRRDDGSYIGEIQVGIDTAYFKFTRGTWKSTECRWDGGMCSNRCSVADKFSNKVITAKIRSWNDLSAGMVWLKTIFLLLFMQSIILLSFLLRYYRNTILIALSVIIAIVFFTKYLYVDFKLFFNFPHAYFLPAICYAFIGPWMYIWFKSNITKNPIQTNYIHFLPILPLIWFLQFLLHAPNEFYLQVINNKLMAFFFGSYTYAIILHLFFNYKIRKLITVHMDEMPGFANPLATAIRTNWLISTILFVTSGICVWMEIDMMFVADWIDNILWLGIGCVVIYIEWSFFIYLYNEINKNKQKPEIQEIGQERWALLKSKLVELMETKAVYTNPGLMLSDIAKQIGTNGHYVSKLINEEFNKSFTDYINTFRIEAFIKSVESDTTNRTFLSHAFEVGFNSKSAFNRAFKNITNTTPSEYFSKLK